MKASPNTNNNRSDCSNEQPPMPASSTSTSLQTNERNGDDSVSVPPALTAAAAGIELENSSPSHDTSAWSKNDTDSEEMKLELDADGDDAPPVPASQMTAAHQCQEPKKRIVSVAADEGEIPMRHDYAAMLHEADYGGENKCSIAEKMIREGNAPISTNRVSADVHGGGGSTAHPAAPARTSTRAQRSSNAVSPPVRTPPPYTSQPPQRENNQVRNQQHAYVTAPPPQHMSSPSNDEDEENTPTPPTLEATLVQSVEATLIVPNNESNISNVRSRDSPLVYVATQVHSNHRKYIYGVLISVVFGAMAGIIAMLVGGDNSKGGGDGQPIESPTHTAAPVPSPKMLPNLSPMAQLQSSAFELVPNEDILPSNSKQNVAIHGDTVIVGAHNNGNKRGFVIVYARNANGEWSQQAKLVAPDGAADDRFGYSVGIHGDTATVGALRDDDDGENSGSVHLFVRNGDTWMHQAKLVAPDAAASDWFGQSVGIHGDTVIVGAHRDDDDGENSGSVHMFVRNGDTWTHEAKLVAPDGDAKDYFGANVGIFGDTAIVGAPWDDNEYGEDSGSVHLFVREGNIWMHQVRLVAPDGAAFDYFGRSVGIFEDTVIVSAFQDDDSGENSGSVHLFVRNRGIWVHQAKLLAPDGSSEDRFGRTFGIFGDTAIVGTDRDDDNGEQRGSVHFYVRNGITWRHHAKIIAPKTGDQFGRSVDIYNGTAISGSASGEVYVLD